MLNSQDNETLVRVGPGTAMGQLMRLYWIPFLASADVERDGQPHRVRLLGEDLVAFRDSEGQVGLVDQACPHRGAPMVFARNEESGIRCVYHGWKFDVRGNCVDMPNVPARQEFKDKVHAKAYRTTERNGLVWVYMGRQQESPPPLPNIEANLIPGNEIWCLQRECNWLQALEGDIDTSHVGFLHVGMLKPEDLDDDHPMRPTVINRAPEYEVRNTDWGTMYGGFRTNDDGQMSWRVAHFMFPFWTQTPNARFSSRAIARAWVPMDDHHSMLFDISGGVDEGNPAYVSKRRNGQPLYEKFEYEPNTNDWHGRWRCRDRAHNDWGLDRQSQRDGTQYTGIGNITIQDQAVTESMGPITDHDWEHLAPTDQMIARTRRRLLLAARAYRDSGELPPGASDPDTFMGARAGSFLFAPDAPLEQAYQAQLEKAVRWTAQPEERA